MTSDYVPILIFAVVAVALSAIAVLVPALLGPKRPTSVKLATYESGKLPIGPARRRFSIQYYLYAVLFILFDVEVVFLFPWATVRMAICCFLTALPAANTPGLLLAKVILSGRIITETGFKIMENQGLKI